MYQPWAKANSRSTFDKDHLLRLQDVIEHGDARHFRPGGGEAHAPIVNVPVDAQGPERYWWTVQDLAEN
jgi:hypothetical protein